MKKYCVSIVLLVIMLLTLVACGNSGEKNTDAGNKSDSTFKNSGERLVESEKNNKENQLSFKVSDFISEPDNKITEATGGRARTLEVIPAFPDADRHFYPSTEDYCLMCYPAVVYREQIDTVTKIAKFDLISFDKSGEVDSHYQAFVFDSAEDAEKYHEYRKDAEGVKYRELYAGSDLSDDMMTGCAKRYDNIIYFNMGFQAVGMKEAYKKTYLASERTFYEGIGYSYLFSIQDCTADPYNQYVWTTDDEKFFYPTSPAIWDTDNHPATENIQAIIYTLINYDEYGNRFSSSQKIELPENGRYAYIRWRHL